MNPSNIKTGNYTDGTKITYEINNTGGTGNSQWGMEHVLTYDNQTGMLQKYIYEFSNTTLSSSITIALESAGFFGDIPGFEFIPVFGSFLIYAAVIALRKREKR